MNNQQPSLLNSSSSDSLIPNNQASRLGHESQYVRAKASEAVSKLADVAQQAGGQAKQTASSLASDANQKAKGFLNQQVASGAELAGHVANSARCAADNLDQNAPQLAELVRGAAKTTCADIRSRTSCGQHQTLHVNNRPWSSALPRSRVSCSSECSRAIPRAAQKIATTDAAMTIAALMGSARDRDSSMAHDRLLNSGLTRAVSDLLADLADLVRKEVQLAKAEVTEKIASGLRTSIWMVAAAVLGLIAVLLLVEAVVFAIASFGLALHWSCLLVAAVLAAGAAAAFYHARSLVEGDFLPTRTTKQVTQDIETAKEQLT